MPTIRRAVARRLCAIALTAAATALACTWPAADAHAGDDDARVQVVGGQPAPPGEYPAQAALFVDGWFCGGSLLGSRHVLTAAHCVTDDRGGAVSPSLITVGLNRVNLDDFLGSGAGDLYGASAVDVHSGYDPVAFVNDIAMVKLDRPAALDFLPLHESSSVPAGASATVVGWGRTSTNGPASDVLLEAELPVWSQQFCQSLWGSFYQPSAMLCAGDADTASCPGDSGGPLMIDSGGGLALVGVVSFGSTLGCTALPGVYAHAAGGGLGGWVRARYPRAAFAASLSKPQAGEEVTFTSTSFHPEDRFDTFHWDFDDDGTVDETGESVSTTFASAGTHTVTLTASASDVGDRAEAEEQIAVGGDDSGSGSGSTSGSGTMGAGAPPASPPPAPPPPTGPVTVVDSRAPVLGPPAMSPQRLRAVLARGLRFVIPGSEPGSVKAVLRLNRRAARRLRIAGSRAVVIGRGRARLGYSGSTPVTVRLTKKARKRLKRARRVTVTLRVTLTDQAGNASKPVARKLTLRR